MLMHYLYGEDKENIYLTESYSVFHEEAWPGFHFMLPKNKTELRSIKHF